MGARLGPGRANATASRAEAAAFRVDRAAGDLLVAAGRSHRLSGRSHDRVLKIARTLADLDSLDSIGEVHIAGALQLRRRVQA
jgi:magnesium chelatase family protein